VNKTRLSKSKVVAGCRCLKRLYLQIHQPELGAEPNAAAEAIIEQGREVGMLARQMFVGGIEVRGNNLDEAIRATRALIVKPDVSAIFEGVFEQDGVLVRVDILHRRRDGRWRLIEVKSTSDLKDHHIEDVAIQYRVVSRCGLDLASAGLAHVNRNYIREGAIDPKRFFKIRNLTRRVQRLQPKLTFQLRSEFTILSKPEAPDVAPGRPIGSFQYGVYAFYDYFGEPIYVGRTKERIGTRTRRHLTNQRTDAVAMSVLDPVEVAEVEVWPFDLKGKSKEEVEQTLTSAEYTVKTKVIAASKLKFVLNEKDILVAKEIELPKSYRHRIVPSPIYEARQHPDIRIAQRAATIADLAKIIVERKVKKGLRRTLHLQAVRLQTLAKERLDQIAEPIEGEGGEDETGEDS
jgi:hypothetical protein